MAAVVLAGAAAIWFATPWLERWLLGDKYHLGGALLAAALVSGVAKVVNSFTRSVAAALSTAAELASVNVLGWIAIGVAVAGGMLGARWGLAGVIYGVGAGWVLRCIGTYYFAARHLRLPAAAAASRPATAP